METRGSYKNWLNRVNVAIDATGYSVTDLLAKADGDACRATEWVCRLIGETNENGELVMTALTDELMHRFLTCQGNGVLK